MRVLNAIPILSLVGLAVLAALALRSDRPYRLELEELQDAATLPQPVIRVGDATLEGTVVGPRGDPVPGATLMVVSDNRPLWTETDGAGRFRLTELEAGAVRVAINHVEHRAAVLETVAGEGPVTLRLPERLPDPPELPSTPRADLLGRARVRDGDDLSGYEVALLPSAPADRPGSGVPRRALLDARGSFWFPGLEAGEYRVLLLPPEAQGGTWPDLLTGLDELPRSLRLPPENGAQLDLQAVAGEIAGQVLVGASGSPVVGAMIQVFSEPAPWSWWYDAIREGGVVGAIGTELFDALRGDVGGGSAGGVDEPRSFPAVRTGTDGGFSIRHLPPGRYRVVLTAGENQREVEVTVPPRSAVDPGF